MRGVREFCGLTVALVVVTTLCGCGSTTGPTGPGPTIGTLDVEPYPGTAQQYYRYRDVVNNEYVSPTSGDPYEDGVYDGWYDPSGLVTYDLTDGATLIGMITATGLKPNFAYQVKLEGMPTATYPWTGSELADPLNWTNKQLGASGRWWCNNCGLNVTDNQLPRHRNHMVLGYLLFDFFVSDGAGAATQPLWLDSSFHVLWRADQRTRTSNDGELRPHTVRSSCDENGEHCYAYAQPVGPTDTWVYAEWEPNRPLPGQLTLPAGDYQCRLLLTEESFHNSPPEVNWPYAVTRYADGGFWAHALSDDQFAFTIVGSQPPPSGVMHVADIAMALEVKGALANAAATVSVVDASSPAVPVSGVTVTGTWSDIVSGSSSGVTDASGRVTLKSPKTRSSGKFVFTVSGLAKDGWTYDPGANVETSDSITKP